MRVSSEPPTREATAVAGPVGAHASRGAFLLMIQALAIKGVTFAGGIVMARLLAPSAYGIFGMAMAAAALPALVQGVGATEILIQRSKNFRRWANASFWMSLALGVLSMVLTLATAPVAGFYYAQDGHYNYAIVPLVALLGLACLFNSLGPVPAARLQIELRFGYLARMGLVIATGSVLLGLVLAWLGLGAWALLIPWVLMPVARGIGCWTAAPVRLKWHMDFKRWKYLLADRGYVFAAAVFQVLVSQGDYMTLGHLRGDAVTGIYFWAFNLSLQTTVLVGTSLSSVLFPSLSRLSGEPERLAAAFTRSVQLVVVIGVPMCFLQAVVAEPVIHVLFKPQWYQGIPIFQILSVGMAFQMVVPPMNSLWSAQGRFRGLMNWSIVQGTFFLGIVIVAAHLQKGMASAVAVSVGVAVYYLIVGPVGLVLGFRGLGLRASQVVGVFAAPVTAGVMSGAVGLYLVRLLPGNGWANAILQATVGTVAMLGLYIAILRLLKPALLRETALLFNNIVVERIFRKIRG